MLITCEQKLTEDEEFSSVVFVKVDCDEIEVVQQYITNILQSIKTRLFIIKHVIRNTAVVFFTCICTQLNFPTVARTVTAMEIRRCAFVYSGVSLPGGS